MLPRFTAVATLAALLMSCGGPKDQCNESTPCPSGQVCQANVCVADNSNPGGGGTDLCPDRTNPSVPNLLPNPGFECGDPPVGWTEGFFGTIAIIPGRNSPRAVRYTTLTDSNAQTHVYYITQDPVMRNPGAKNLCGAAFVRGDPAGWVTATIRKVNATTGKNDAEAFHQPLTADWQRIETSTVTATSDTEVLFGVGLRGAAKGVSLEIDDTGLWVSTMPDGGCAQR